MTDLSVADTLRAAGSQLRSDIERATRKDRSVMLRPAEATPLAELLFAIAEDMDFDGADIRTRHLPGGKTEPGIFHGESGSYLHDWTQAWNAARAILGDGPATS